MNKTEKINGIIVEAGIHEFRMSDYSEFGRYVVVLMADGTYQRVIGRDLPVDVDATAEQIQAYKNKVVADDLAAKARAAEMAAELEAKTPRKGKMVEVVRGRKVPVGTRGIIFWMQEMTFSPRFNNGYRKGPDTVKIGIALDDQKDAKGRYTNVVWTYQANVEVVRAS